MKVLIATVSTDVDPLLVIGEQRRATMANLQDYTRLRAKADGTTRAEVAWLLQLDRLVLLRQAELRWLDDVEQRLSDLPVDPAASQAESNIALNDAQEIPS